jgi:hypothetical protein
MLTRAWPIAWDGMPNMAINLTSLDLSMHFIIHANVQTCCLAGFTNSGSVTAELRSPRAMKIDSMELRVIARASLCPIAPIQNGLQIFS